MDANAQKAPLEVYLAALQKDGVLIRQGLDDNRGLARAHTLARIKHLEDAITRVNSGVLVNIHLYDLDGNLHPLRAGPPPPSSNLVLCPRWNTYQQLTQALKSGGPLMPGEAYWKEREQLCLTTGTEFRRRAKRWRDEFSQGEQFAHIDNIIQGLQDLNLESVVCFGVGVLGGQAVMSKDETLKAIAFYHVIEALRDLPLQKDGGLSIKIHLPMGVNLPQQYEAGQQELAAIDLGISRESFVNDFKAFQAIKSSSAIISWSPNFMVREILADLCMRDTTPPGCSVWEGLPLLIICNTVKEGEDHEYDEMRNKDPNSPRVEWLFSWYNAYKFSERSGESFLGDLTLYVRKPFEKTRPPSWMDNYPAEGR